jgi:hypothetical protein
MLVHRHEGSVAAEVQELPADEGQALGLVIIHHVIRLFEPQPGYLNSPMQTPRIPTLLAS